MIVCHDCGRAMTDNPATSCRSRNHEATYRIFIKEEPVPARTIRRTSWEIDFRLNSKVTADEAKRLVETVLWPMHPRDAFVALDDLRKRVSEVRIKTTSGV